MEKRAQDVVLYDVFKADYMSSRLVPLTAVGPGAGHHALPGAGHQRARDRRRDRPAAAEGSA